MGCDRIKKNAKPQIPMFQSTHPHGVRRRYAHDRHFGQPVSIHAPTWGATFVRDCANGKDLVSIHAPTWGATLLIDYQYFMYKVSIHAPTWGATAATSCVEDTTIVSIHAPTWGATPRTISSEWRLNCFNPRTHMGCDP